MPVFAERNQLKPGLQCLKVLQHAKYPFWVKIVYQMIPVKLH